MKLFMNIINILLIVILFFFDCWLSDFWQVWNRMVMRNSTDIFLGNCIAITNEE